MGKPRRKNYCFAPGCKTGYSRVKDAPKLSLFSVPEDEEMRRTWERNLHRKDKPLEVTDAVCELHFEGKYVLRDYVHVIDGKEVRLPRGKPSLSPDAVPTILPNLPRYLSKTPSCERPTKKRASSRLHDHQTKRRCIQEDDMQTSEAANNSDDAENRPFELSEVPKPTEHWALHKFPNYDGVGYVLATLDSEKNTVSVEKTVLMNYSEDPNAVICRSYVRKTLVSESVSRTIDEAKQVLEGAHSLQVCKGAGILEDFAAVPITQGLKQQMIVADGLVQSFKCKGTVNETGEYVKIYLAI